MSETTLANLAEMMPDIVRRSLQETYASFEARATGNRDTDEGKQDGPTVKEAQQEQGQQAPDQ